MRPLSGRDEAAARWGPPTEQEGSANEPRTRDSWGVCWNERWIYRDPEADGLDRILLFHRYDLVGVFRVDRGGRATAEPAEVGASGS